MTAMRQWIGDIAAALDGVLQAMEVVRHLARRKATFYFRTTRPSLNEICGSPPTPRCL
jgi:hypothetical protein